MNWSFMQLFNCEGDFIKKIPGVPVPVRYLVVSEQLWYAGRHEHARIMAVEAESVPYRTTFFAKIIGTTNFESIFWSYLCPRFMLKFK